MSQKKKNNIMIGSLCAVVLLMVVGYAAFQSVLNITGTSKISSNWNILITDIKTKNIVGGASNASEPTGKGTLTATFNTNLVSPGDSLEYDITVTNSGTLNAVLEKITLSDTNNPAIKFTTSGLKNGDPLNAGGTATLTVKVEYDNNVTSQPNNLKSELTVTLDYVQEGTSTVVPGGDTFTGTIYRNNTGHFLVNGKSINETTLMYYPSNDYSSIEEALADGYLFVNEADCIANGNDTCSSGELTLSAGDYVENPSSLGKVYLKHIIENDIVLESYVCFVTDTEHCMQGGNASYYDTNKTLLQGQQTWFTNNGGSCTFYVSDSRCYGGGSGGVYAYSNGNVRAYDGSLICYAYNDGVSNCYQSPAP